MASLSSRHQLGIIGGNVRGKGSGIDQVVSRSREMGSIYHTSRLERFVVFPRIARLIVGASAPE